MSVDECEEKNRIFTSHLTNRYCSHVRYTTVCVLTPRHVGVLGLGFQIGGSLQQKFSPSSVRIPNPNSTVLYVQLYSTVDCRD